MKITTAYIVILIMMLISCSKKIYDSNYQSDVNHSSFYIVDTIKIKDPVRIHSPKYGGQFIVSRDLLKEYNGKVEFFTRSDVFFMGNDLYRDLNVSEYKKYSYPDGGGCTLVQTSLKSRDLEIYEFQEKSINFILGLMSANYFYVKHNSYEAFKFPLRNREKVYFRIAYPLCR